MGLSAILGVKDSTGERVDKALGDPRGQFLPTWLQLGTGFTSTVTKSGNFVTIGLTADASAVVTFDAVRDALEAANTNVGLNGYGFAGIASLAFDDLASAPVIFQAPIGTTGATASQPLTVRAQAGRPQTGGADNNDGGDLYLSGGAAGTGGGGAAGKRGRIIATTRALDVTDGTADAWFVPGHCTTTDGTTDTTLLQIPLADNIDHIFLLVIKGSVNGVGRYLYSHVRKIEILSGAVTGLDDGTIGLDVSTGGFGGLQPPTYANGMLSIIVRGKASTTIPWYGYAVAL